jgi:hypothetical protein
VRNLELIGWDSPSKQGPNIPALFRSISVTAREKRILEHEDEQEHEHHLLNFGI